MTPAEAKRIVVLSDALDALPALEKAAKKNSPKSGYSRRVLYIAASSECDAGGEPDADIEIDPETGRLLLPLLRKLITDELEKLGVTP
jgi:hypothetical protein